MGKRGPKPNLARYIAALERALGRKQDLLDSLFPEQRAVVEDKSPLVLVRTSRRGGKTTAILAKFLDKAKRTPGLAFAYIALTRPSAEQIAWSIIKDFDRRYGLGCRFTESKLRATLPNGSTITLYGADRKGWASRLLGTKLADAAIDEAAFFSTDLNELIHEVIGPALADLNGQLYLTSTPGPWLGGVFYEADTGKVPGWSCHRWDTFANPHMEAAFRRKIDQLIAADPKVVDTPFFRRMYKNEWVTDLTDLVYHYVDERNGIDASEHSPENERRPKAQYVLGLDLGWHDRTAMAVLAWSPEDKIATIVESFGRAEMELDEAAGAIRIFMEQYPGLVIVGDPARKQAFEELRRRYGLPILQAWKSAKLDWIDLLNSDLATGRLRVVRRDNAELIEEMGKLIWHRRPNGMRAEMPGAPNDFCDATLYAYRYAYHWASPAKQKSAPKRGTPEYAELEADRIEQALLERYGNE